MTTFSTYISLYYENRSSKTRSLRVNRCTSIMCEYQWMETYTGYCSKMGQNLQKKRKEITPNEGKQILFSGTKARQSFVLQVKMCLYDSVPSTVD